MRQTRRIAAALSAGLLLLTACGNDADDNPEPIGGDEDAQEDSDPEPDEGDDENDEEPYAVPDEIDEDYAEDVINALLEVDTEIHIVALQQSPGEPLDLDAADRLHAIAEGDRRDLLMENLQGYVDDPTTAEGLLAPDEMEPTRLEVDAVLHAETERCLIVAGWWDRSGNAVDPPPPDRKSVFSLARVDRDVTSLDRNPTPWRIRAIAPMHSGGEEIPQEQWGDIDFGDALDRACEDF